MQFQLVDDLEYIESYMTIENEGPVCFNQFCYFNY